MERIRANHYTTVRASARICAHVSRYTGNLLHHTRVCMHVCEMIESTSFEVEITMYAHSRIYRLHMYHCHLAYLPSLITGRPYCSPFTMESRNEAATLGLSTILLSQFLVERFDLRLSPLLLV